VQQTTTRCSAARRTTSTRTCSIRPTSTPRSHGFNRAMLCIWQT
jgi:hypothetical protein